MKIEKPKLPQARMYLEAAKWGIEELESRRLLGKGYVFHVVGILSSLRAVQHALLHHDRNLSDQHKLVVDDWKNKTPMDGFEISFIKNSRDQILKAGSFESWAIKTESGIGEGSNYTVTREEYDIYYYNNEERRSLMTDMRSAALWCKNELNKLEAKLPIIYSPE